MILTEEQILAVKKHLSYEIKYQETFNEVFDHVMLVINQMPDSQIVYPETLTNQIIELEFGSYDNLKAMEKASTKLAFKAMQKKHWQNIMYFFNWPVVLFTASLVVLGYYFCVDAVNRKHLMTFTATTALFPMCYLLLNRLYRKYKEWYHNDYRKPSIKDGYIFNTALLSNSIITILLNVLDRSVLMMGPIALLVFVLYSIFVLSFFKLYRQQYRLNIAQ